MEARAIKRINRIFHDEEAKFYDERHPEIERERRNWDYAVNRHLPSIRKGLRILDIGTGTGFVPSIIDKYLDGGLIVCADISKQMLQNARANFGLLKSHFEFVICDAETIPLKDESIDIITINSTLHHIPDYNKFLDEISRTLSKRGVVFIMHEPNKLFYNSWILHKMNRVCRVYLSFKSKFEKNRKRKPKETGLYERVNQRLINENVIPHPLSPRELQSLVDIHSPTASGITDRNKGFIPERIASHIRDLSIVELKTYNHLGKIDPNKDIVCFLLSFLLAKIFRRKGYLFSMVLARPT